MRTTFAGLVTIFVLAIASNASADAATISIGNGNYAQPPNPPEIIVVRDDTPPSIFERPHEELPKDPYRAPFRLTVGPAAMTSGQGVGPGLITAADFGTGPVGVRFSAAWFRGESADDPNARFGSTVGLYSGELVLDLNKTGPFHPVLGLGIGAVNIGKTNQPGGWALAGLGRIGFEYAFNVEDADVRIGAGLTGALLGPADDAIASARAFAMMNATLSIGF